MSASTSGFSECLKIYYGNCKRVIFTFYWFSSILTRSYTDLVDNWDEHVRSLAFDKECDVQSKRLSSSPRSSEPSESIRLWEDDEYFSMTSIQSAYKVPKLEKHLYYFRLRGNRHHGPKLVFRTSTDVFTPPTGSEHDPRVMQLLGVYHHNKLGQDNLWATIREEVHDLLEA